MPPSDTLSGTRELAVLEDCQETIGYRFRKPELLRAALTHTSGANTRAASNERLEFLGDSVLGLVTCEQLFLRLPDYQEGDLTKVKSVVVSRKTCARFSQELGLGNFLFLGKGVSNYGEIPSNMLADVFESLVAAIFLDGGWVEPRRSFCDLWSRRSIVSLVRQFAPTRNRNCNKLLSGSLAARPDISYWMSRGPITTSVSR